LTTLLFAQDDFFEPSSSIGGYGELHYNVDQTNEKKSLDFHRFVLFYGYEWTPQWSLTAEVELEHNYVKSGQGELELEQAFVDYHPNAHFGFRAGVVLAPVGIINLTHEPPTFLSVERPDYSSVIIPTTWFGNGAAIYGTLNEIEYNLTIMESLNGDAFSPSSGIRGGRMKGYKSNAEELMTTLRVDYAGLPGTRLGFSYSMTNAVRSDADPIGINLFEFHAQHQSNNMYSVFEIGNISYSDYEVESSFGYYVDLGYNIGSFFDLDSQIIPWFRWTDYNTANATVTGGDLDEMYHFQKWLLGVAFKPIDQVVFKLDYGVRTNQLDDEDTKLLNLGVGYMF
jgi:hypothetical protein